MWQPKSWGEIEDLIGQAEESAYLDFKREVSSKGSEIAKDLAAMTVDGGVLLYGVDEDPQTGVAKAIVKVPLKGQEERLRQIAASSVHPAPSFEVTFVRESETDPDGVIVVAVPPSPLAPHEVGGRFPRRDGTTTTYLSEPEIERLYRLRRHGSGTAPDAEELLAGAQYLPGIEERWTHGVGRNVGVIRLAAALAGDTRHPADPWLAEPLREATAGADAWLASRSRPSKPFVLERLGSRGWRPEGADGWATGMVTDDATKVLRNQTVAGVLRYPSLVFLWVTVPLRFSPDGEELEYACTYEDRVALELLGGISFFGHFFAGFAATGDCHAAVELQGFGESIPYRATHAAPGPASGNYAEVPGSFSALTPTSALELSGDPKAVARRLIERWLAAFDDGPDLFDEFSG
jgi:hypothetical protein